MRAPLTCLLTILLAGIALILTLTWLITPAPAQANPDIRYVAPPPTGNDVGNDCTNPSNPCATIQHAINVASFGDLVSVAAGTYAEHITMRDGVSVHGQGWVSTTIDGGHTGPTPTVYMSSVWASTVLSGVQVTGGGTGVTATSTQDGGGIAIWYAAPTIVNTWVNGNTARNGGGVFARYSSPTLDNVPASLNAAAQRGGGFYLDGSGTVTVTDASLFAGTNGMVLWNTAGWDGGGFYISEVTATVGGLRIWGNSANGNGGGVSIANAHNPVLFTLNQINWNSASNGGGLDTYRATRLSIGLNMIDGNTARNSGGGAQFSDSAGLLQANWLRTNAAGAYGGGAAVVYGSPELLLRGNWIEGNSAGFGGGVYLQTTANPLVDGNVIVTNTANTGGGIGLFEAGVATVTNNIVARNVASTTAHLGGGILVDSAPARIVNNTIADNIGDGVLFQEAEGVAIVNNIVTGNLGDGIEHYSDTLWVSPTLVYTADYNDVWNNSGHYVGFSGGTHDLHVNPQFVASGDMFAYYHIQATSPVSTTGSTAWAPQLDMDGDIRILGGSVSMGADEFFWPVALTGVSIDGPVEGRANTSYVFTATVAPVTATPPITYTWVPTPSGGQGTPMAIYTWSTAGTKTITVTAENTGGSATDSHQIGIAYEVYLPLVLH